MDTAKSTRRPRVRRLTEIWLREQLGKRRAAREEWGDTDKPGLRVRFGTSGAITWVFYKSTAGKNAIIVLGRYPDLGLRAARERLDEERRRARQGLTGVEVTEAYEDMTVAGLVAKFTASLRGHRRRPERAEDDLERTVLKRRHGFKHLKVRDVAPPAWHAIVEDLVAKGHPTQAAMIHRLLAQMLEFARQFKVIETSPFQGVKPRALGAAEPPPRKRVLSLDELRALLTVLSSPCQRDAKPGRLALLVLLLTGKRTGETLKAKWANVDLEAGTWTIPEANRKAKMHAEVGDEIVPLAPRALAAFKELKELAGDSPWVFRSPHGSATGRLADTALALVVANLLKAGHLTMAPWVPHDLRRTARSCWAETLRIPWDIAERLLGHELPKIARTYDAVPHLEQRREALEKWALFLDQLEHGGGTVAFLPAAGGAR